MFSGDDALGLAVVGSDGNLRDALRADHSRALGAHFPKLGEPSLIALAPCGNAAFQPVRLNL